MHAARVAAVPIRRDEIAPDRSLMDRIVPNATDSSAADVASVTPVSDLDRTMPDIAHESRASVPGLLDRVGMSGIETMVLLEDADGVAVRQPAKADAHVDLADPDAKGIHMSRLYMALQSGLDSGVLTPAAVEATLRDFVESHGDLATAAHLSLRFDHMVRRSALLSEASGWRSYPVRIDSHLRNGRVEHGLSVVVTYSSTCPCSAALARQLLQEGFSEDFAGATSVSTENVLAWLGGEAEIRALPHAQRSVAEVTVVFEEGDAFDMSGLIDAVEAAVETSVQTVVKRIDEQEFARLNAANLMFCEDAARRIRAGVEDLGNVLDYRVGVRHLESLHPHDAVAIVTKGVPGGLTADTRPFGLGQ